MEQLPVIALVGRPNVGKSTLFNRLTRTRDALVADVPGLTRDRHYAPAMLDGRRVVLIDTGGFEPVRSEGVAALMARQTRQAILEADLVVLVTDGRQGLAPRDLEIANELRRATPHVLVAVNKTEGMRADVSIAEFHRLGLGEPVAISSAHGDGIGSLVEAALARLADRFAAARNDEPVAFDEATEALPPAARRRARQAELAEEADRERQDEALAATRPPARRVPPGGSDHGRREAKEAEAREAEERDAEERSADADAQAATDARVAAAGPVRVAVVGRPNGGKSTLINALLGEERLVAFDQPGTTRDAIDVPFRFDDREFVMVDTAGIRRRAKVDEAIEKFSVVKTLQAIERSHVCILVIDAASGISDQDASIASYIVEAGRALVVVLNKWDSVAADDRSRVTGEFDRKLHFLAFAAMHTVSAIRHTGLKPMMRSVIAAHRAAMSKLPTPKLTRLLQQAVAHQQPARQGPVRPKLRYAHQGGQNPPIIVIHGSALNRVDDSYRRFLERWFAEHLSLRGTPLRIAFRTTRNPYVSAPVR